MTAEGELRVTVDGVELDVAEGSTVMAACAAAGVDTPTLCWAENLTPVNVCRLCVVEVEGSRALVPACSRPVEADMVIRTDTERVQHSRRMILEFLASSTDLSQTEGLIALQDRYGADPQRWSGYAASTQPLRRDDELFVRAYDRCVLCYKCVEACGTDAQHTFAIAVGGRGFFASITTEFDTPLSESACVYCGNCVGVCPTNALQFTTEFDLRAAGDWRPDEQDVTTTVCSYCGVGCNLELHTQDDAIVKVTSPNDHDVTSGHLCIKGRFGWQYVQPPTRRASVPRSS